MDIVSEVKLLELPPGQYVVFGSGPMQVHGIRESSDIDLLFLPELYEKLKQDGWREKILETHPQGRYMYRDNIEAGDNWDYGTYNPDPKWLIENAEIINGIPFAPLREVIKWKKAFGRRKDLDDIKLIEEYLRHEN
jgi:hypothetical protein